MRGARGSYGEGEAGAVGVGAPQTDRGHAQVGEDHPLERGQQDVDQAQHLVHHHDTTHATRDTTRVGRRTCSNGEDQDGSMDGWMKRVGWIGSGDARTRWTRAMILIVAAMVRISMKAP